MSTAHAAAALLVQAAAAPRPAGTTLLSTLGVYLLGAVVLIAAVGGAAWAGRRLRADLRGTSASDADATAAAALGPSELSARHVFRTLQEKKIATAAQLAAMSPRERQLLFETVATKVTPLAGMPAVRPAGAGAPRPPAPPARPAPPPRGPRHGPPRGAVLTLDEDAPRSVTHCDGCGRRVAARRDGGRLTVTVDER